MPAQKVFVMKFARERARFSIDGDGEGVTCHPRHIIEHFVAPGFQQHRTFKIRFGATLVTGLCYGRNNSWLSERVSSARVNVCATAHLSGLCYLCQKLFLPNCLHFVRG